MSDTYVIPPGSGAEDYKPGSTLRENMADTYWAAVTEEVAGMYGSNSSSEYDFSDPATYNTIFNQDSTSDKDVGLFNKLWEGYERIRGIETDIASNNPKKSGKFEVFSEEEFKDNFTRKNGPEQYFEKYVQEQAVKIAGEVNAHIAGVSEINPAADPNSNRLKGLTDKERRDLAAKYKEARQKAELAGSDYDMPDLPGRESASVSDFKEQCFMLAHIFKFAEYKLNNVELVEAKRLPYHETTDGSPATNACLMAHGEPYAFMNKLTQYSSQSHLLNLETSQISNLVPKIRLFKVREDESGNEISQEFNFDAFPSNLSIGFFLKDKKKRGVGVGIQDFTFSYEGTNPFSVKKSIKASLQLVASSFDELFRIRTDLRDQPYRYVDLALKTGGSDLKNRMAPDKSSIEYENIEALNFRIKAVVGWQRPPGKTGTSKQKLDTAINNSFVTLNLTPTIHKFEIQEDGSVRFVCNYLAYIESHFDKSTFNVFGTEKTFKRQIERKLVLSSLNNTCDSETVSKVKDGYKDQIKKDINQMAPSIIQRLMDRELIRYVNIPFTSLAELNEKGPYSKFGNKFYKTSLDPGKERVEKIKKLSLKGSELKTSEKKPILDIGSFSMRPKRGRNNANYSSPFFYVSDLVDVVLESISERLEASDKSIEDIKNKNSKNAKLIDPELLAQEKIAYRKQAKAFKKMRVLLGPVEIVDQQDPTKSKFVNMGDLPVSLKYFVEWLSKQTINKASVDYSLPRFLNQLFKDFINTFLNDDTCYKGKSKQRITLSQAAVTAYKNRPGDAMDTIGDAIARARLSAESNNISRLDIHNAWPKFSPNPKNPWPVLNVSGIRNEPVSDAGAENEINYLIYYAARAHPVEKQNGRFHEDLKRGVHHYAIGKDRGIVKNIRMTATDVKYLKELRFKREGYDGLEQLREVYNVSIDCYANVNTFPGTYIYVDPRGWSPSTELVSDDVLEGLKKVNMTAYMAVKQQDLTRFGIGGYYMIKRSEHSFGPGKANTIIEAQWTHQSARNQKKTNGPNIDKPSQTKCAVSGEENLTGASNDADSHSGRKAALNEYDGVGSGDGLNSVDDVRTDQATP